MIDLKKIASAIVIVGGLSVGGLEVEKTNQLSDIQSKEGVNGAMVIATMLVSDSHRQDVEDALIAEYETDGYVDYDNFALHQIVFNNHFQELADADALPDWYFDQELTNDEMIDKIHDSLKNN